MRIKTESIRFVGIKKILSIFAAAAIGASLVSCGGKDSSSSSADSKQEDVGGAATTAQESKPVEEKPEQITTSAEKVIEAGTLEYVEFSQNIEAQEGLYSENIAERKDANASGGKYLIGLSEGISRSLRIS